MQPLYSLIFSKDRACQLDSLLRSMRKHITNIDLRVHILYLPSDPAYAAGYERAMERKILPDIQWLLQTDFRQDLIAILGSIPRDAPVMLLVDDDVFFREFSCAPLLSYFSSRYLYIDLCFYIQQRNNSNLPFYRTHPWLEWKWAYWIKWRRPRLYPFCLDGHIYHNNLLFPLVQSLEFNAPNSLEGALNFAKRHGTVWRRKRALAPSLPVLYNNPLNCVQQEGETEHAHISPADMNARYCAGFELDNELLYCAQPDDSHFSAAISFIQS